MAKLLLEHDPTLGVTFVEIPFSDVQTAQVDESLIHINVAIVCNISNLVLAIAQINLGHEASPRIVLTRESWTEVGRSRMLTKLRELSSEITRRDRYVYM